MMYWKLVSFDSKLSDRKNPSSSEDSFDKFQNCWSVSCAGAAGAAIMRPRDTRQTRRLTVARDIRVFMRRDLNTQDASKRRAKAGAGSDVYQQAEPSRAIARN